MRQIFWDTNIFIYLFENHPEFGPLAGHHRQTMLERGDELFTSTITLGEIQVLPKLKGNLHRAIRFRNLVAANSTILPFDGHAADAYSEIRTRTGIRGPDALQLACASAIGLDYFVTNDRQLYSLYEIAGIGSIVSISKMPF